MYEEQIDRLQERLNQEDLFHGLVNMVDRAIEKNCFHHEVRNFIESLIRQRQLLINQKSSRKNAYTMVTIIDNLKRNLEAIPSKDLPMARFFILHEEDIRSIIPGRYPSRRFDTFIRLRDQAREINKRQIALL